MSRRVYEVTIRVTEYTEQVVKSSDYRQNDAVSERAQEIAVTDIKCESAEVALKKLNTIIPAL